MIASGHAPLLMLVKHARIVIGGSRFARFHDVKVIWQQRRTIEHREAPQAPERLVLNCARDVPEGRRFVLFHTFLLQRHSEQGRSHSDPG